MALFYISNVMTQQQTCFYQARCLNQLNCIKPEKTKILVQWCLHPQDSRISCVSCKTQCNTLSAWLVCFDENCLFLPMIKTVVGRNLPNPIC